MERKTFTGCTKFIDEAQGIVEAVVAVTGNLDMGNDVIVSGAFKKTLNENRKKIKVLDNHRTDSVVAVVGKALEIHEVPRTELPADLLQAYPEATGGLYTRTQYLMDTPEGLGAFKRIQNGAVSEYSIGYDPKDQEMKDIDWRGEKVVARFLKQVQLWEYSPVIWGMNEATATLSAKNGDPLPQEIKPWDIFKRGDKWVIYKVNEEGEPVGRRLGAHESEEEAQAQLRALYANAEDEPKKSVPMLLDVLSGSIHKVATVLCDDWYINGTLTREERGAMLKTLEEALDMLDQHIPEDVKSREVAAALPMIEKSTAPEKAAEEDQLEDGPAAVQPPTETTLPDAGPDELRKRIDLLQKQIELEIAELEADLL